QAEDGIRDKLVTGVQTCALPICPEFCLNSLRFGPITESVGRDSVEPTKDRQSRIATNRRLFTGVVSGIAHYGNCVGIPTIGGERSEERRVGKEGRLWGSRCREEE